MFLHQPTHAGRCLLLPSRLPRRSKQVVLLDFEEGQAAEPQLVPLKDVCYKAKRRTRVELLPHDVDVQVSSTACTCTHTEVHMQRQPELRVLSWQGGVRGADGNRRVGGSRNVGRTGPDARPDHACGRCCPSIVMTHAGVTHRA